MLKDTHELIAEAFGRNASLKDKLVRPFGVDSNTVTAWARPKSSDINPFATGKGNPLDRTEKVIEITHVSDPEMAREIAEHFPKYVDELDRQRGLTEALEAGNPCLPIANLVEAQARFVKTLSKGCENPENVPELLANTKILKTRVLQLEACLRALLQSEAEEYQDE